MREVVICEPVRTPVGRFGGVFKDQMVAELGTAAVAGLLARTGLAHDAIEDVIFAQGYSTVEAPALGRVVALDAGLPITSPGGKNFPVPGGMIETAENLRRDYGISREEQDEYTLTSHCKAVAAQEAGHFDNEIIPVTVETRGGDVEVSRDEHPRADVSLEALAKLKPLSAGRLKVRQ